ncbi:MAG: bifunctional riboflavin kinase/FMN adenylyltransferase [bacterium]|nr:bifunctional riboflavin kinase/FMN adenylyltransferase [bacterium]
MRLIRLSEKYIEEIIEGRLGRRSVLDSCSLTLGSFDGLHRGHRKLLNTVRAKKSEHDLADSVVFTFRQHPRELLDPASGPFLLTSWREKLSLLEDMGCDVIVAADFCPAIARLDYETFVDKFLVKYLGMKQLVVGYDAHLGAGRQGTAETLAPLGEKLGFGFQALSPVREGKHIVSSSLIRQAVLEGKMERVTTLLGRPFSLWGEVCPGDQRGREIGFPTANVQPLDQWKILPDPGVYAVRVQVPGDVVNDRCNGALARVLESLPEVDAQGELVGSGAGQWVVFAGMLNFGKVPTFHGDGLPEPRIEANIFGFEGDLRGRNIKVDWICKLRAEKRFESAELLVSQLKKDSIQARKVLGLPI